MPCPLECTEPCQRCYEKTKADGVKEYACYGQCVVVDQMGISHNGPGEAAPAGWTPSAGGSMAEMIADEIANINNSEPTPTSAKRACSDRCGTLCPEDETCWKTAVGGRCRCYPNSAPPPRWWEPLNRLVQTTVEEQKSALSTARRSANFDKSERIIINTNTSCKGSGTCYACNSAGCDCGSRNTCYERYRPNEDGLYPNVWYHECVCSLNKPIGGAGTGWRRKTQEIKPTTIPKDTPWPEDTEPVNNV